MNWRIGLLSIAALLIFGLPAMAFGNAAWKAIPRETCQWRDQDFCSDYGLFYWSFCGILTLVLIISLWAIHRRRRGN